MKNLFPLFFFIIAILFLPACKSEDTAQPCDGNGMITFNNKTDSTVDVQIMEAHNSFTVKKDYIKVVTVKGNATYSISIQGRNLNKDTTMGIHNCETKTYTILR